MLAAIQDQKHPLVPQESDQAGDEAVGLDDKAQRRGEQAGHEARISEWSQIDKADRAIFRSESVSYRDGDCGLANAPGAHDGYKTLIRQLLRDGLNHRVTPYHASEARRNGRDRADRADRRRYGFAD